jgi:hypothetical protein
MACSRSARSAGSIRRAHALAVAGSAASLWCVSVASAYIGSCGPADGYHLNQYIGNVNWADVSYFNAGSYGANAGGGPGPTLIAADSGKWKVDGQVGGYWNNAATRASVVGSAPPYPGVDSSGASQPIYMVGNHFPGRGGDGSNLAFRNDTPIGTGAANYNYFIDTYDTGGNVPSSVTSGIVTTQFYFCPNPNDLVARAEKFTMSFKDSANTTGVQWGYARDNEVYWRAGNAGPWTYTGIYANASNWDGIRMNIDLSNDTFELEYYIVASNTWTTLAPAGTALGAPMTNLTTLGWRLEDGVNSGTGGKNYFDDFGFSIPAPSSAGVLALAGLAALRRRR